MSAELAALQLSFPSLTGFARTSEPTMSYNCHAWGGDTNLAWWEPRTPGPHPLFPWIRFDWPGTAIKDSSLSSFQEAYETLGFVVCASGVHERGVEKIAQYGTAEQVTHTARQLPWGAWTSKLGRDIDIEHASAEALEGPAYGSVIGFMQRREQAAHVQPTGTDLHGDYLMRR